MGEQVKTTVMYVIQRKRVYPYSKWEDVIGLYYDTKEEAVGKKNWLCVHLFATEEDTRIIQRITTEVVI